jgi:Ca2+/H+ antiporter, TMEM165/GDT1 family
MIDSFTTFPVVLASSFSLIGLAEIGDKSQLVCMTLAVRYRAWPVLFGAIVAFALLNLVAVVFGAAVAHWLPQDVVVLIVGVLFLLFGIHAFRYTDDDDDELPESRGAHGLFFSTLLLITLAEFGDKTQIAVAGLSGATNPYAVWIGATLALAFTSALGVFAGRTVVQYVSVRLLHRISGVFFMLLGSLALLSMLA